VLGKLNWYSGRLQVGQPGFNSWQRQQRVQTSSGVHPPPPIPWALWAPSLGIKRQVQEVHCSSPSELKKRCSYFANPPIHLHGQCLIKHRNKLSTVPLLHYIFHSTSVCGGQSSWLQNQRSRFDSRLYQIIWEVVGLERGPLSLVSTTEELLDRKSSSSGLENREYGHRDPLRWPRDTLYAQKLALTSLISSSHSVSTVRSWTEATEFVYYQCSIMNMA
jgi:hypothetical protein